MEKGVLKGLQEGELSCTRRKRDILKASNINITQNILGDHDRLYFGEQLLPLEDYLMPNENIRYQSDFDVVYGDKQYTVVLTDIRLVLYSRRGLIFKSDDVVTEAIRDIQGIKYKESGMIFKSAYLEILSKSKIVLSGNQAALKTLYQRLLPFLSPELRSTQSSYAPAPPTYAPPVSQTTYGSPKFCSGCGIELSPNERFCHNCGKPVS